MWRSVVMVLAVATSAARADSPAGLPLDHQIVIDGFELAVMRDAKVEAGTATFDWGTSRFVVKLTAKFAPEADLRAFARDDAKARGVDLSLATLDAKSGLVVIRTNRKVFDGSLELVELGYVADHGFVAALEFHCDTGHAAELRGWIAVGRRIAALAAKQPPPQPHRFGPWEVLAPLGFVVRAHDTWDELAFGNTWCAARQPRESAGVPASATEQPDRVLGAPVVWKRWEILDETDAELLLPGGVIRCQAAGAERLEVLQTIVRTARVP